MGKKSKNSGYYKGLPTERGETRKEQRERNKTSSYQRAQKADKNFTRDWGSGR